MSVTVRCPKCQASQRLENAPAAGQACKCRSCGATFRPAPPTAVRTASPAEEARPARVRRAKDEGDSDEQRRPRRPTRAPSGGALPWVLGGLAVGVLLLGAGCGGVGLLLWKAWSTPAGAVDSVAQAPLPPPPAFVPREQENPPPAPAGADDLLPRAGLEQAVWVNGEEAPAPLGGKDRPLLVLDAHGHSASIKQALFSRDGKQVITACMDKTVRVWDLATGETVKVFRLPQGPGKEGALFAAALAPDGKTLAVGGIPVGAQSLIYFIDLESGKLRNVLRGPSNVVVALDYSRDGTRLAAATSDRAARVFEVSSGKLLHTFTGHTDSLTCLAFSPDGSRLATSSHDRTARVWSLTKNAGEAVLRGHTMHVHCVAWSPDGTTLATGSADGFLRTWDIAGNPLKAHPTPPEERHNLQAFRLAFTPDGREILYGGVSDRGKVGLMDAVSGHRRLVFNEHNNTVMDARLSADGSLAVTTGGNDHETLVWSTKDGTVLRRMAGAGHSIWGVGWAPDSRAIAWGTSNAGDTQKGRMPLTQGLRLDFSANSRAPTPGFYTRALLARDGWTLSPQDFFRVVAAREGKRLELRSPFENDRLYSMTLLPGQRVVLGGSAGMYLVDLTTGKVVRSFVGHSGLVLAVAPSPDGRYFLTGSTDQTLRIWSPERVQPLLSIFVVGQEWIAWTPEGYYSASPCGERLMGWLVNRGSGALASYYPAAQFRRSLYQPEVIRLLLSSGSLEKAVARAGKALPGGSAIDVAQVLPPEVTITSPTAASQVPGGPVTVEAEARSVGGRAVRSLRLLIDGRPYQGDSGVRRVAAPRPGKVRASWTVEVPPGTHHLHVLADSAVSQAVSAPVAVTNREGSSAPPDLYVLAVGVSAYPGERALRYAASDAVAIAQAFKEKHGGAFGKVEVQLLTDRDATKARVAAGLAWLGRAMTPRDVGVVFFSGHGTLDPEGNFYLVPVDVDDRDPRGTCIAGASLKTALRNVPGRLIAILDACHSGASREGQPGNARADDLVRDLVTDDYGVLVMCSSLGEEYSMESTRIAAGFFTRSLVEGLSGRADLNGDRIVHFHEWEAYAQRRVRAMTGGMQNPVTGRPANFQTFPVARAPAGG